MSFPTFGNIEEFQARLSDASKFVDQQALGLGLDMRADDWIPSGPVPHHVSDPLPIKDLPRDVPESPMAEDEHGDLPPMAFSRPEIKIDPAANDKRFREWTFPGSSGGHGSRPSVSRRHTMPSEATETESAAQRGVASTLMERVDDLRQLLGRGLDGPGASGAVSRQPSVEFPLRPQARRLTVVNATPSGALTPTTSPINDTSQDNGDRLDQVLHVLGGLRALLSDGIVQDAQLDTRALDRISQILEDHTALLDSIHQAAEDASSRSAFAREREAVQHAELVEGQEILLAQVGKTVEAHEASRRILHDLQASQAQVGDLRSTLEGMREELLMARGAVVQSNGEKNALAVRLSRLEDEYAQEKAALKAELADARSTIDRMSNSAAAANIQVDQLMATGAAAESERDALAEAFRSMRDKVWGLEERNDFLQQEVSRSVNLLLTTARCSAEEGQGRSRAPCVSRQRQPCCGWFPCGHPRSHRTSG